MFRESSGKIYQWCSKDRKHIINISIESKYEYEYPSLNDLFIFIGKNDDGISTMYCQITGNFSNWDKESDFDRCFQEVALK